MRQSQQPQTQPSTGGASTEAMRKLAMRFQQLLEEERTRLAGELHDDFTQKLTVISLELSLLEGALSSEHEVPRAVLREKCKLFSGIVNELIQSCRRLKAELRPKVLD